MSFKSRGILPCVCARTPGTIIASIAIWVVLLNTIGTIRANNLLRIGERHRSLPTTSAFWTIIPRKYSPVTLFASWANSTCQILLLHHSAWLVKYKIIPHVVINVILPDIVVQILTIQSPKYNQQSVLSDTGHLMHFASRWGAWVEKHLLPNSSFNRVEPHIVKCLFDIIDRWFRVRNVLFSCPSKN